MFTLAHLSDAHLPPLPGPALTELSAKRISGLLSWGLNRRKIHRPEVLAAVTADMAEARPDHIAFTGDLVNVALAREWEAGRAWLEALGSPRDVTMVPGNHDAYTRSGQRKGLESVAPFMLPDGANEGTPQFPFTRFRRNVALIGLSTSCPTPIFNATGTLGAAQLEKLGPILEQTRERGFARVVMLHHPPAPGLAIPRKALTDAAALTEILARHGAELVLYGHNHLLQSHVIEGASGPVPCFGIPSASALPYPGHPAAAWAKYTLKRQDGSWHISALVRGYDPESRAMRTLQEFNVGAPA